MAQETLVRLKITSATYTPGAITSATGLQCDKSWHAGDTRKPTTIVEKDNGWILNSGLSEAASLDEHMESLLGMIEPAKEVIRSFSATDSVELSIVIYAPSPPALNFPYSIINRAAELGASIDIDLYII